MNLINTLNFDHFKSGTGGEKDRFIREMNQSLTDTGFFLVENPPIKEKDFDDCLDLSKHFFDLEESKKMRYAHEDLDYQVGYVPFGMETGEYLPVPDRKECFQTRLEGTPYVQEIPRFNEVKKRAFDQFNDFSLELSRAFSLSLGMPAEYFSKMVGNSMMRNIYYPPDPNPIVDEGDVIEGASALLGMCASKHTDLNPITLLKAKTKGLQLLLRDGKTWIDITTNGKNVIIFNLGMPAEHITGGRYLAGIHRVVCEANKARYSMPFFVHWLQSTRIVPLEHLGESDLVKYHFNTMGEFLTYRLNQLFELRK